MFGLFSRRKPKSEDTSPAGTPSHTAATSPEAEVRQPPPDQGGNVPYPLLNAASRGNADYDQLYTFMDWTVIEKRDQNLAPKGDQVVSNYLTDVPFRTAMVSASDMNTVKDLDLLLLQFSTKLSSVQTLVTSDYDFALENQIMDEARVSLAKSESTDSSNSSEHVDVAQTQPNDDDDQLAQLMTSMS